MKGILFKTLTVWLLLTAAVACTGRNYGATVPPEATGDTAPAARLLTLEQCDGYELATIDNPWGEGVLRRYALVPRQASIPDNLPAGTVVVRTPVSRALVYSVVHTSALKDLGAGNAIAGVADAQFFTDPDITTRVAAGEITDCGSSTQPDVERIIRLAPDAVVLDTYQSANFGQVARLDVPIIECADYMENAPLGRAEWIKFYGSLVGRRQEADSIYNAVVKRYETLRDSRNNATIRHPRVLTESVIAGVWNVPGGDSYMAAIIADAGGIYPWADIKTTGSLSLDIDRVLAVAQNADVWLIKSFNIHSLQDLQQANPLHAEFRAFKTENVYVCDTNSTRLYELFPFHPDILLREYIDIFDGNDKATRFFKKVSQ